VDRLDGKSTARQIADETQLGLGPQPARQEIDDLGDRQNGNDQRARVRLEQLTAGLVVPVVGVDVRIERTGVDDEGYRPTSRARISSIRSETSA
jgi:hypothetical protein